MLQQSDDRGLGDRRFKASGVNTEVVLLRIHQFGVRRLLLAVRTVAPQDAAALGERLGLSVE